MRLKELEKDVQRTILDWLELKRIFHYRNNTGAFKDAGTGAWYKFGAVGSPDIIVVKDGKFIGIECKSTTGKQSDNQKEFQLALELAGGRYVLAHSLDEFLDLFW